MTNSSEEKIEEEASRLNISSPTPTTTSMNDDAVNDNDARNDPNWRSRVLYCRKCDGHGKQVALKGHAPKCPYNLCECQSCSKLMTKRLHSFKKRNKSRLEAAAILTAQKKAQLAALELRRLSAESSGRLDVIGAEFGGVANVSQASTSHSSSADSYNDGGQMLNQKSLCLALGADSKPLTVMSYEIWKERCAARKNAVLLQSKKYPNEIGYQQHQQQQQMQTRKRSFDSSNERESPKPKRSTNSSPGMHRPNSLSAATSTANIDWSLIAAQLTSDKLSKSITKTAEYRRITLPTIPPISVLVGPDDAPITSTLAATSSQHNTINSFPESFPSTTSTLDPKPSSESLSASNIDAAVSPAVTVDKNYQSRASILVNLIPSLDARLKIPTTIPSHGDLATNLLSPLSDRATFIHKPSPNLPPVTTTTTNNSYNLLKLPINHLVNLNSANITSSQSSTSIATPLTNSTSPLIASGTPPTSLSYPITQLSSQLNGDNLADILQNDIFLRLMSPSFLSSSHTDPTATARLLLQQQPSHQPNNSIQQLFSSSSAAVNNLLRTPSSSATSLLSQQSPTELVIPLTTTILPSTSIHALDENNPNNNSLNGSNQLASILQQIQQHNRTNQLLQPSETITNLLSSNELLNFYQMLSDPITSHVIQAQLKQLEHSGLLFGQSIAT